MASEPTVKRHALPVDYSFVPKGNIYITANCRKDAQAAGKTVYVIVNSKNVQIGIGVPGHIHSDVSQKELQTRAERAKNVEKRDSSIEKEFEKVIRHEFPRMPAPVLPQVLEVALSKGKGKVGRTGTLDMRQKAHLAVRAHIRHCHTPYDALMRGQSRGSATRNKARDAVQDQVDSTARSWGGKVATKPPKRQAKKKAMAKAAVSKGVAVSSATKSDMKPRERAAKDRQRQAVLTKRESLATLHANGRGRAELHCRESPDNVIDLTRDDSDSSSLVKCSPRNRGQNIVGTDDYQSNDRQDTGPRPMPRGRPETQIKGSWPWMQERMQLRAAGALPPAQRSRVTRSMRSIEEPIQELLRSLPDSP